MNASGTTVPAVIQKRCLRRNSLSIFGISMSITCSLRVKASRAMLDVRRRLIAAGLPLGRASAALSAAAHAGHAATASAAAHHPAAGATARVTAGRGRRAEQCVGRRRLLPDKDDDEFGSLWLVRFLGCL